MHNGTARAVAAAIVGAGASTARRAATSTGSTSTTAAAISTSTAATTSATASSATGQLSSWTGSPRWNRRVFLRPAERVDPRSVLLAPGPRAGRQMCELDLHRRTNADWPEQFLLQR
jgi:hypothetical protein